MKKILITVALGVTLFAAGCSEKEKKADVVLESYSYDVFAKMTDADSLDVAGWQYCHLEGSGVLPKDVGDSDIRILRDSLISMAGVEYVDTDKVLPKLESGYQLLDSVAAGHDACSSATSTLTIGLVTPKVMVWSCLTYSYPCLAAHGAYATRYLNYDIKGNKILRLADLFVPGYEKRFSEIVNANLKEEHGSEMFDSSEPAPVPDNFCITTDGIMLCYPIYSIGPYSSGEIKVELNSFEIEDILNSRGRYLLGVASAEYE